MSSSPGARQAISTSRDVVRSFTTKRTERWSPVHCVCATSFIFSMVRAGTATTSGLKTCSSTESGTSAERVAMSVSPAPPEIGAAAVTFGSTAPCTIASTPPNELPDVLIATSGPPRSGTPSPSKSPARSGFAVGVVVLRAEVAVERAEHARRLHLVDDGLADVVA